MFIFLVRELPPASSFAYFKLTCKTSPLLLLVMVKHGLDLKFLCIDYEHFYFSVMLQFFPASGSKMD